MSGRRVYFNGHFVPEAEARVSIFDSGVVMGDMAFEITRTCRQAPFRLAQHLDRLFQTLEVLEIDPGLDRRDLEAATFETLARNLPTEDPATDWTIVHNISRGPDAGYAHFVPFPERRPTVIIACLPLVEKMAAMAPAFETGLDLVVTRQKSIPSTLLDSHVKTRSRLHYQLANLQAAGQGRRATAILTDPDGYLTEGTTGNVFLCAGGRLLTPAPRNILLGVTRELVLDLARRSAVPVSEADLTVADALAADEVFITSTSIGILHARSFNGRILGDGRIGPIANRLRAALFAEIGLDLAEQARGYAERLGR